MVRRAGGNLRGGAASSVALDTWGGWPGPAVGLVQPTWGLCWRGGGADQRPAPRTASPVSQSAGGGFMPPWN